MKYCGFRKIILTFLSISIIGLSGCQQSPVRNPFAGRSEPKLGELPSISESRPIASKVAWSTSTLSKQVRFSKLQPYLTPEYVYAADRDGKIIALNRQTGKTRWKSKSNKKYSAGPYLIENYLLLTTSDAKIVALDAHSGREVWEKKLSTEVLAPLGGYHDIVVAHATDGSVTALTLRDGNELWRIEHSTPALTLRYCSKPIVVDEKVIVGFATGKLSAFDLHTGSNVWERAITIPRGRSEIQRMVDISADPIVIGDVVYAITYQGKLAAVSVSTGDLQWERDLSSYQNMANDENYLYVTDNDYHIWAIDRFTGETKWKQNALAERYITGPAIVQNKVAVADRAGYVHYLSAENGHVIDRQHFSGKFYQNPMRMGDSLLVSTYQGKLLALNLS